MKRDQHGRLIVERRDEFGAPPCRFPHLDNECGDNLIAGEDDEPEQIDEGFNWTNNPVRREFDNPKDTSHRSHIYDDLPSFPEE